MSKKVFIIIALVVLAIVTIPVAKHLLSPRYCRDFNQAIIQIGERTIAVAVASTPEQRAQGLAGCQEIPQDRGMYFPYDRHTNAAFWMKGMLIPLDIIWIADGQVIGIEENVPPPSDPAADPSQLPRYHSPEPVTGVLEIAAGGAAEYKIDVGDPVQFD